jgi:hypothetical protein
MLNLKKKGLVKCLEYLAIFSNLNISKMNKSLKITSALLIFLFGLYIWGEISAFKILKKESGNTWNAAGVTQGGAHHK